MDVIATAGHVDHGKSALVRALTGMEPDRWEEERRRGLTIDLGFAWTMLPSGRRLAVGDVPGHERFVGNMLAGVGSVPAALVVVAADDGWSAQTAEHVAVLDALGVRHALLAVTKSDLADPAPVLADARERLAATSMGHVAAVAVSARTGEGMPQLTAATCVRIGSTVSALLSSSLLTAMRRATQPPEIDAVRVPPSAWITSQSTMICRSPSFGRSTTARRLRPISR